MHVQLFISELSEAEVLQRLRVTALCTSKGKVALLELYISIIIAVKQDFSNWGDGHVVLLVDHYRQMCHMHKVLIRTNVDRQMAHDTILITGSIDC